MPALDFLTVILCMHCDDNQSVSKYTCLVFTFSIFFKVLSIGYVISGFLIKFQDDLLQSNVVPTLNLCNLGIFPLGSFINAVIFAPTPALIVNVLNSAITYIGIYKRRNHYLQIVSIIYKEYFIKYLSFFLSEVFSLKVKKKKKSKQQPF